jgi:hypothetical protein
VAVPVEEKTDTSGPYTYTYWFEGGLIYHDPGESGVAPPTLCVRTGDTSTGGWSVHT